ncbi:hypothetical protein [Nocardioides sp.]|uniref:hypothetical protein n=1 Tax=Nocardioides sp. TaxID=35761 RepID=UPI00286DD40E|nr:hypothetical protein [Nocardioides sp.]
MKAQRAVHRPDARRSTDVASANVLYTLGRTEACKALDAVLGLAPDLIGLQEWYPSRLGLLLDTGRVGLAPHIGGRLRRPTSHGAPVYLWNMPLIGGCAVGARADRFELVRCRTRFLSAPGRGDPHADRRRLEPPREATVAVYRDLLLDRTVCLVNYHLVSGVQVHGRYRADRPVLAARHRHETEVLGRLVHEQIEQGHVVYATGDSNFHGLRIDGLTSAWEGRQDWPGTLGPHRKVDDVHGQGPAEAVTLLSTPSDHVAIVVRRPCVAAS